MTKKSKNISKHTNKNSKSSLVLGLLAGLAAPSIFCTPPSYGSHIHRGGLHTDFRNVGIYIRSSMSKNRLGAMSEKAKKF